MLFLYCEVIGRKNSKCLQDMKMQMKPMFSQIYTNWFNNAHIWQVDIKPHRELL